MFEAAELGRKISKNEFDEAIPDLRASLLMAQRQLKEKNIGVAIVVSGVETAGKGDVVNRLNEWLDTRGVQTHAYWDESVEETERPPYWRYWRTLPARGDIAILFGSWYTQPIIDRGHDRIGDAELDAACKRINDFERMLTHDGLLIIKFWLHLSQHDQKLRLKKLKRSEESRWRMAPETEHFPKMYQTLQSVSERAIRQTDTGIAPWFLIESSNTRYRDLTVGRTILRAIEERLASPPPSSQEINSTAPDLPPGKSAHITVLDHVDLSQHLERDEYRAQRKILQSRLNRLSWAARAARKSSVIVFEGWDASGKGGAIRRLTETIDARLYRVIPVAAPTDEEKAQHYLWRFWRHIPRAGRFTLYDRSWYGRVLVERIEGYASEPEWRRAYREINEFEQELSEHGIEVIKFWIHISAEEQLRRFREREVIAYKQHKITEEDWRNRERWDDYCHAVNEMVIRTSTEYAPWNLIGGDDKRAARIQVLRTVCDRLESALENKSD